ncbi:MAG: PorV/PorQ family protein [Saprospiraceae bacterium]|nr:PorV/PorQ family protein [Saprospiraceae bacterium]
MKNSYILIVSVLLMAASFLYAGNPDRQGEAGAGQLLINPWAKSAGFHSMNTSSVTGVDAMFLNVGGMSRINRTQVQFCHTRYLEGADMNINAFGLAQRLGKKKSGAFGVYLMSFDLGDFDLTTENTPEGTGATFSPAFYNMGVSYSHLFANRVSVGFTFKVVHESISDVSATAFAVDAGVQYVSGPNDNFKFGIALRNVGSRMQFSGEGLSEQRPNPNPTFEYPITYFQRSASYELPSQLNLGASYDFLLGSPEYRLTALGNFTSNAFSRDQIGGGVEFAFRELFALRVAYKTETDYIEAESTLDNGIAAGFSASLPLRKKEADDIYIPKLTLEYGYRTTKVYDGIHNIGVRIDL